MGVRAGGRRKHRGGAGGRDRERFQDGVEGPGSSRAVRRGTRPARNDSLALSQLVQTLHSRPWETDAAPRRFSRKTSTSEVHMEFAFLGREDDPQKTMAVLVAKERTSKMIMSAGAPRKTTGTYISKRVASFLREVGVSTEIWS